MQIYNLLHIMLISYFSSTLYITLFDDSFTISKTRWA